MIGPLLTSTVQDVLRAAGRAGDAMVECSLDLERTVTTVEAGPEAWTWKGQRYPYLAACRERTIYHWAGAAFEPVSRYGTALVKLVPTQWGPPTFEIDGIKMLPTLQRSPYEDAGRKVALVQPRGKLILDTCGGLGYFAAWCLQGGAVRVQSYEKSTDVLWLRSLNPWSPPPCSGLELVHGDVATQVASLPDAAVDAVLHDPPRFGIAGELYAQAFYDQLARVLKRRGLLFHYTGSPNRLTTGRDVPQEVSRRLQRAGFRVTAVGDGLLARK